VIYVDGSVLLTDLFAEPRSPPEALWDEDLASSRLLAYDDGTSIGKSAGAVSGRRSNLGCIASGDGGIPARERRLIELASYDNRLLGAARTLEIPIATL
jgi:hypothetical protein